MKPTRIRVLLMIALIGALAGFVLASVMNGQAGRAVPVPYLAAFTLWLLALALFIWAYLAKPRLQRVPGSVPLAPIVAARTAALAMAASRTGALVAGFYIGLGVGTLPDLATPAGISTVRSCGAAALGAIALVAAALWLEHLCRLPAEGDSQESGLDKVSP